MEETLHPANKIPLSNDNNVHLLAYLNEETIEDQYETSVASLMETNEETDITEIRRFSPAVQFASQNQENETKTLEERIPKEFHKFLPVFSNQAADRVPEHKPWDHKIELKPGFEPKSAKIYPLNPAQELEAKKFIDEHLKKGTIRPSESPMASSFFFVDKKRWKAKTVPRLLVYQ